MCIKHFIVYRQTNAYILCESNRMCENKKKQAHRDREGD